MQKVDRSWPSLLLAFSPAQLIVCIWLISFNTVHGATTTIQVQKPCEAGNFFDISGLECKVCGKNEVVSSSGVDCVCVPGYIKVLHSSATLLAAAVAAGGDGFTQCQSCLALGKVPSKDGSVCMKCDNSTGADLIEDAAECSCPNIADYALVEFDPTGLRLPEGKKCFKCPTDATGNGTNTWRDPKDSSKCMECPRIEATIDMYMIYSPEEEQCVCPAASLLPEGVTCISPSESVAQLESQYNINMDSREDMTFYYPEGSARSSRTFASLVLRSELGSAGQLCSRQGDRQACNMVANMCVMQQYAPDSAACKLYQALALERVNVLQYHEAALNPEVDWAFSMPWLYYNDNPEAYTKRHDVTTQVSFSKQEYASGSVSDLVYVLSAYALNGTWLGFKNLTTQFQVCGGSVEKRTTWARFGTNFLNQCTLPLSVVLNELRTSEGGLGTGQMIFYDLYLQDLGGVFTRNFPEKLYPVPVLNLGLRSGGVALNSDQDPANNMLVRRFFIRDEAAAVEATGLPAVAVRHVSTFDLTVTVRHKGGAGRIFPPLLTLTYAAHDAASVSAAEPVDLKFKVLYTMDLSSFWKTWDILLAVSLVWAGLMWLFSMFTYNRRRRSPPVDRDWLGAAVLNAAGAVGKAFFFLSFAVAGYWFVFYKGQDTVFMMIPEDAGLRKWKTVVTVAVSTQAAYIAYILYRQTTNDIFFLDWEKPRWSLEGVGDKNPTPVSVWRTLLVANEWNELQTTRLSSLELTLTTLLLLLYGFDLGGLGAFTPNSADLKQNEFTSSSAVLRFALSTFLFILCTGVQLLFKVIIVHKYIEHPLEQFVDLLTLTNTSIVLLQDKYSGYYMHGRSLMAHADTNMIELNAQMHKEQEMQVAARGLISKSAERTMAENQCFEIYITPKLREKYESKLLNHIERSKMQAMNAQTISVIQTIKKPELAKLDTVKAQQDIADTFRRFINNVEANASTHVRITGLWERLLNVPPDMMMVDNEIFVHDFQNGFGKFILYGIEFDLLIFNILVFAAIDMATTNWAVAAFLTYAIESAMKFCRAQMGENNISEKTLVDSRFLI